MAALVLWAAGVVAAQTLSDPGASASLGTGTPTAAPSHSRAAAGAAISDRLDRPGRWRATRTDAEGRCVFAAGRLEARTGMSPVYRCEGPDEPFAGDQAITVDATILTSGTCAAAWFRMAGADGYLVSLCETEVRLGVDATDGVTGETRAAVTAGELGRPRRLDVAVEQDEATVTVDGTAVLRTRLGEPSRPAGRVTFGVIDDVISGDARAAFARAEVMEL
ncbi:hypothetical protein COUCH_33440 [Couchioplanes caeruleus]|uniref:hypothetical protein n=1 Tax=Couchioplanes caeruleus TaxID=56438 RepID=UPI0020BF0289|nr:hypothetical protein [Couchioplanes caeruleus]UQU63840.1 hypothetical protein COUCH_33440 [Couchioplanes caeruleus]